MCEFSGLSFNDLRIKCNECHDCELCETRTNVVFGAGNEHAEVMFIGEGPGQNEDLEGEPFVGRSGKLLDQLLLTVDLSRKVNIFIGNMVKCRPPLNRDPKPEEQEACSKYLERQIELIDPKIIVCVGRIAALKFIGADFKITKDHGKFVERNGRLVMGTFHPAALLRNPNFKPDCFSDLLKLRDKIMEIAPETYSEKNISIVNEL